jgi:hypothetical protein
MSRLTHLFVALQQSHIARRRRRYVALIFGAAVGPNPAGDSARLNIAPEILELLGTTKPPPEWVSTDPLRRGAYYLASYRFVKYLIETKGMEPFWKLYASEIDNLKTLRLKNEAVQAPGECKVKRRCGSWRMR